jgi:DNA polymerase sigma
MNRTQFIRQDKQTRNNIDEKFLGKKRKHEEDENEFKVFFRKGSESEDENLKLLNKNLDEDDEMNGFSPDEKAKKKELLSLDFIAFKKEEKVVIKPKIFDKNFPWLSKTTRRLSGILKLDSEISDFYNFIKPTEEENTKRKRTYEIVKSTIQNINPAWKIKKFGSFPNQIHLPDSDVDIIVLTESTEDIMKVFKKIRKRFVDTGCVDYVNIIEARVPIIRATIKETKINIDIR